MAVTKYLHLLVVLTVCCAIQGNPLSQQEEFEAMAKRFQEQAQQQFEDFKRQSQANFGQLPTLDVKNLPKDGNTHVFGESQSKYHVETNVNGKKTEESGGHKVINDDGKITEYDLP